MDISPGLFSKACILLIVHLLQASFLCLLLCCPRPLCNHGNSCLLGSTTSNQQWLNRLISDHNHCGEHMSISVICWPMRVGIQFGLYSFCNGLSILKQGQDPFLLLLAEWQDSVLVLNIHVSDSIYDDDFWLLSLWHLEPYQHFTAQHILKY